MTIACMVAFAAGFFSGVYFACTSEAYRQLKEKRKTNAKLAEEIRNKLRIAGGL